MLETFAAINRPPLSGLKGHGRLLAALGADRRGFHALGTVAAQRLVALAFTGLAPLGLVLEAFVGVKELLARGKHEIRAAVDALQDPVLVLHASPPCSNRPARRQPRQTRSVRLSLSRLSLAASVLFVPCLLAIAFTGQRLLHPLLFTRFEVIRMAFHFFDNVFLLNLPLEAAQRVFQGLAFLKSNLSQKDTPPSPTRYYENARL